MKTTRVPAWILAPECWLQHNIISAPLTPKPGGLGKASLGFLKYLLWRTTKTAFGYWATYTTKTFYEYYLVGVVQKWGNLLSPPHLNAALQGIKFCLLSPRKSPGLDICASEQLVTITNRRNLRKSWLKCALNHSTRPTSITNSMSLLVIVATPIDLVHCMQPLFPLPGAYERHKAVRLRHS